MPNNLKYSGLQTFGAISAEQISITGQYTLPLVDGSANQFLSTNGSGTVSFVDISSLAILTTISIIDGTGINWTVTGLNTVQGNVTLAPFSTTNLTEGTNLYFTNERVDDRVAVLMQSGTVGTNLLSPLVWQYSDTLNKLIPQISLGPFNTDLLSEGSTNLYFTGERVDDRVASLLKPGITGTNPTNPIIWNYVDGLDSLTPQISLGPFTTDSLAEGSTNLYFTNLRAELAVAPLFINTPSVSWTYDPFAHTIEANASVGLTALEIKLDGSTVGTQPALEFITGANMSISGSNDPFNNLVQIQLDAAQINLEDLLDVVYFSPGPQLDDILYFDGASWTNIDAQTYSNIIGVNYEELTYAQLVAKAGIGDLKENRMYLINNYQTIYSSPNTSYIEMTAAVEPLIVKAISNTVLSPIAFSPNNPNDIIYYQLQPEGFFRNKTANSKGVIHYRHDTVSDNSYPGDFRGITCRRWDDGSGNYEILNNNGNGYQDFPIFEIGCVSNKFEVLDTTTLTAYGVVYDLPNIYLPANSSNNYFSSSCFGLTFGATISHYKFYGISLKSIFRLGGNYLTARGLITNSYFYGQFDSTVIGPEENTQSEVNNTIFYDAVIGCKFSTLDSCIFNAKVYYVDCVEISNSVFSGPFENSTGFSIIDCIFNGAVDNLKFNKLEKITFEDVLNCQFNNYISSGSNSVGTAFANNTFLQEISDTSFGDSVSHNTFCKRIIASSFKNDISFCQFNGEVESCSINVEMTQVNFNGNLNGFTLSNTSTPIRNAVFITNIKNLTIATGSLDLEDIAKFTEVVTDSLGGSGFSYERYLDLIGSPSIPEYVYSALS